jgi:hypothetical protein
MPSSTMTVCPHCSAGNPAEATFCGSCGKALPTLHASGPQLVMGDMPASSGAGNKLLGDELARTTKKAATALMWVAILQTIFGPIALMAAKAKMERESGMVFELQPIAYVIIFSVAAAFWGLFFWARKSPLPAAIVGLVLFITLHVVDAVADPATLLQGWIVKIIVVVVLSKAISAGLQHRRLLEAEAAA